MSKTLTTMEFIKKAIIIHNQKYDYSNVIYINSHKKIEIYCNECKKYFEITPNKHLIGRGCPNCRKLNKEVILKKFTQKHGEHYNYSLIENINSKDKIKIFCNKCSKYFYQTISVHLKSGCPNCYGTTLLSINDLLLRFKKIHNDKYSYNFKNYKNTNSKITITCKDCGYIFEQKADKHLKGQGCKKCQNLKMTKTTTQFIIESKKIHYDNYNYDSSIYIKANKKVKIYCNSCKNTFEQTPNKHLQGRGCPICTKSFGEKTIINILKNNNIDFIAQKRFDDCKNKNTLPFDFYLPKYNTCIEFDGKLHYFSYDYFGGDEKLKNAQFNDNIKNEYCLKNNIHLSRIKYDENIEEKMSELIRTFSPCELLSSNIINSI